MHFLCHIYRSALFKCTNENVDIFEQPLTFAFDRGVESSRGLAQEQCLDADMCSSWNAHWTITGSLSCSDAASWGAVKALEKS